MTPPRRRAPIPRRQFVKQIAGAALVARAAQTLAFAQEPPPRASSRVALAPPKTLGRVPLKLHPLDYQGVRLLPGPFADRLAATREFYLNVPNDDILKGFREKAKLPAPGRHLGGWCASSSAMVFGQWLSGMSRLYRATGDQALRDKALYLMTEWGKTASKQPTEHYFFDKFVCGLVDMALYAGCADAALPLLAQQVELAEAHLKRDRLDATDADSQGGYFNGQSEWYTLAENLYRAYLLTGDMRYRSFGDVWLYPHYWGMFNGQTPGTPDGFHAYSHVNTLSSAAMAHAVTGDVQYLKTLTGAYEYFQKTQCYATGGYGPGEKLMAPGGALGRSIEAVEPNTKFLGGVAGRSFETPCGTWAVFKFGRYLQQFTGEAGYADWTERLLYNGIGAALPIRGQGQTFYYADYRLAGARKYYFGAPYPCCAGTYIQDVADLHNILYYTRPEGICVNLFVPSEVTWKQNGQPITLTQRTDYPEAETVTMSLAMSQPAAFTLALRVPAWAQGVAVRINDQPVTVAARPGMWLELHYQWKPNDRVELRVPMPVREVPIDAEHPKRVAYVRGPVVLVRPEGAAAAGGQNPAEGMVPFSSVGQDARYAMYVDRA